MKAHEIELFALSCCFESVGSRRSLASRLSVAVRQSLLTHFAPLRTLMQQGGCEDTGFLGRIFVAFVWRILVTVIRVCEWPVRILFPQSFKGLHIGPNAATDMSCLPKTTYTTHACIEISNASAADAFSFLTHSEQNWKYSKRLSKCQGRHCRGGGTTGSKRPAKRLMRRGGHTQYLRVRASHC